MWRACLRAGTQAMAGYARKRTRHAGALRCTRFWRNRYVAVRGGHADRSIVCRARVFVAAPGAPAGAHGAQGQALCPALCTNGEVINSLPVRLIKPVQAGGNNLQIKQPCRAGMGDYRRCCRQALCGGSRAYTKLHTLTATFVWVRSIKGRCMVVKKPAAFHWACAYGLAHSPNSLQSPSYTALTPY
jgi:hypothetical protein